MLFVGARPAYDITFYSLEKLRLITLRRIAISFSIQLFIIVIIIPPRMGKETLAKMSTIKLAHISSLLLLFLLVLGTTIGGQAWADKFEGTEGPDRIIGTRRG